MVRYNQKEERERRTKKMTMEIMGMTIEDILKEAGITKEEWEEEED